MQFLDFFKIDGNLTFGIIVWLLGLGLLVLVIRKWAGISSFSGEVRGELRKANWPWETDPKLKGLRKYKELIDSTVVVLIGMILLAGWVQCWDFLSVHVISFLTTFFTNLGH